MWQIEAQIKFKKTWINSIVASNIFHGNWRMDKKIRTLITENQDMMW